MALKGSALGALTALSTRPLKPRHTSKCQPHHTSFAERKALVQHLTCDLRYAGNSATNEGWVGDPRIGAHHSLRVMPRQAAQASTGQRGPAGKTTSGGGMGQAGTGELRKVKEGALQPDSSPRAPGRRERGSDRCDSEGEGKGMGPAPADGGQ